MIVAVAVTVSPPQDAVIVIVACPLLFIMVNRSVFGIYQYFVSPRLIDAFQTCVVCPFNDQDAVTVSGDAVRLLLNTANPNLPVVFETVH